MLSRFAQIPNVLLVVLLAFATPPRGQAQEAAPTPAATQAIDGQAQPAAPQRVARLTFAAGELHLERADNTGEDTAVLNMPLREGTRLLCGDDGRAELEFEDGSLLRLTPGSALSLDRLALAGDTADTQVTLLSGLAYFELRAAKGYAFAVHADALVLTPVENTAFRIKLSPDTAPAIAVLSGTTQVESQGHFRVEVRAGEGLRADASDAARYFLDQTYPEEQWDWWNEERDQAASDEAAHTTAARDSYAGQQGYGWSDLDANGTWYDVPGLGMTWQPYAADESFDPYGFGNWVYDSGSYVFVSGYSWGWTPFRCGRWFWTAGFGWGWQGGAECGRWGFGGRHTLLLGAVPGRYRRPEPPPLGGRIHRTIAVRSPDGPRPPVLSSSRPIVFRGQRLETLRPVGGTYTPRGGSAAGRALLRDYPLSRERQPVYGVEAGSLRATSIVAPGWHEGKERPAPTTPRGDLGISAAKAERPDDRHEPGRGTVQAGMVPATSSRNVPRPPAPLAPATGVSLGATHSVPVRPIPQPPASVMPHDAHHVEAPAAPVRTAPAPPPPPPVRMSPPPALPAPVHTAPASPK